MMHLHPDFVEKQKTPDIVEHPLKMKKSMTDEDIVSDKGKRRNSLDSLSGKQIIFMEK